MDDPLIKVTPLRELKSIVTGVCVDVGSRQLTCTPTTVCYRLSKNRVEISLRDDFFSELNAKSESLNKKDVTVLISYLQEMHEQMKDD